jgi:hypothetical protein
MAIETMMTAAVAPTHRIKLRATDQKYDDLDNNDRKSLRNQLSISISPRIEYLYAYTVMQQNSSREALMTYSFHVLALPER